MPDEQDYIQPDWDDPTRWNRFYSEKQQESWIIGRDPRYLIHTIRNLELRPPLRILDAGCGISTLPELAAFLGHRVVAIDISETAIDICRERTVSIQDLERSLGHCYNWRIRGGKPMEYLEQGTGKVVDIHGELMKLHHPGCTVLKHEICDWNDPGLPDKYEPFDLILNQNGLRNASQDLMENSFRSFYRLLKPEGALIETNVNAIVRIETMNRAAESAGFVLLEEAYVAYRRNRYEGELKPENKYAVCCWPTG